MSLRTELADLELRFPRCGPARWRAERQADEIIGLLCRHRYVPPKGKPPSSGSMSIKEYAQLPAGERRAIADHLYQHRIGYWMWSCVEFGAEVWRVCCWQQAPEGGPLFDVDESGRVGPRMFWREIPGTDRRRSVGSR